MNIVLKTQKGYLNIDKGVKIVNKKENASVIEMSKAFKKKEEVYAKRPMIGIITMEKF